MTYVEITNFKAINVGDLFRFVIIGITNPNDSTANMHIDLDVYTKIGGDILER